MTGSEMRPAPHRAAPRPKTGPVIALLAVACGLLAAPALAEVQAGAPLAPGGGFAGFFAFAPEAPRAKPGAGFAGADLAGDDSCIRAIRAAERRHGIPENLLLAIGLQEAGVRRGGQTTIWPWSVNSEGTGYTFESRRAALDFVAREQAAGKSSIDVGCLQVNLRWHPDAFASVAQGFDPDRNADYAARFLARLFAETGDWARAIGNYHSRTPQHHARYLAGVEANMAYVAGLEEGGLPPPRAPAASTAASADLSEDSLDAVLGAFAADRRAPAASSAETAAAPAASDPGWGHRGNETTSIYSSHPMRPVLSGLANFPDA